MTPAELRDALDAFRQRARSRFTQAKAAALWRAIRPELAHRDARAIETAWAHALSDEGPKELEHEVKRVMGGI